MCLVNLGLGLEPSRQKEALAEAHLGSWDAMVEYGASQHFTLSVLLHDGPHHFIIIQRGTREIDMVAPVHLLLR